MKLVCIGDSLTYGYGVPSNSSWVELLKSHLNLEIINKGMNGDTTSGILSRSYRDITQEKPSHVIIMAGTNDMLMNYPLKLIKDNIKFLITEAKENNIEPIVALQPPVIASLAKIYWDAEINYKEVNTNLLNYINWAKTFCSNNNITLIDFYDLFINKKDIKNLYSDGIHPNVHGHKLMFEETAKLLKNKDGKVNL
ncbi:MULTISPECIES: SGNH/GDSL hydrolase family protein [Clostridium]|uniref:SGNH/GDSL hydrolase family protein n=1 Tax=Clostridium TaxID=1485 RepID=UPI0008242FE7|nr:MULTISPECIES: SGNH/GDSL hydrolase family protein [Clostridium]PJI07281.1 peptidase [Clostridium sp. CT7]